MECPVEVVKQVPGHMATLSMGIQRKCSEISLVEIILFKVDL